MFPRNYDEIQEMLLVSSRIESSFTVWLKNQWSYAIEESKTIHEEGFIPEIRTAYIIENMRHNRDEAKLTM